MDNSSSATSLHGYAGVPSFKKDGHARRIRQAAPSDGTDAAGMNMARITELRTHTRKKVDWVSKCGESLKGALIWMDEAGPSASELHFTKKSQLRYCGVDPSAQREHFQTRWKPVDGKMAFCTSRRRGSATVECSFDHIDGETTYHTWKRLDKGQKQTASHLQFERFLTVQETANRSDRLPEVKNRNPPVANSDGPFENPRPRGGNLDRTWTPRADAQTGDIKPKRALDGCSVLRSSHLNISTLQAINGTPRDECGTGGVRRHPNHNVDNVASVIRQQN